MFVRNLSSIGAGVIHHQQKQIFPGAKKNRIKTIRYRNRELFLTAIQPVTMLSELPFVLAHLLFNFRLDSEMAGGSHKSRPPPPTVRFHSIFHPLLSFIPLSLSPLLLCLSKGGPFTFRHGEPPLEVTAFNFLASVGVGPN